MQVPLSECKERLGQVQRAMRERGLAAALFTLPENTYYLSGYQSLGYDRFRALVVPAAGEPTLILPTWEAVPGRTAAAAYLPYGLHEAPGARVGDALAEVLPPAGSVCVGIEESHYFLPVRIYKRLLERFPHVQWVNGTGLAEGARLIKSPYELACIRKAAAAASCGLATAIQQARTGRTENEVASALLGGMLAAGSEYPASPPYVTAGRRTGLPHATWEGEPLREGDGLLVENGASVGRYHAAIMRTVCIGRASQEQAETYQLVVRVLERMIATIGPGVPAAEVDAVGRQTFREAGFERKHNTGYSIGLAFPPGWNEAYLFALNPKNERRLQPGMVLYLIPSLSLEHRFTVGCGDTVLVTENGCETLTEYPRDSFVRLGPMEGSA